MNRIDWTKYIAIDPDLHHGDPCIRGTRIPVAIIIGSLADGMTAQEIIDAYPQLSPEAIQAALAYAADVMREDVLLPFAS
jgi:uncharacterized protein (DUF433 family)